MKIILTVLLLSACVGVSAQEPVDQTPYYERYEDDFREIVIDTALFYLPLGDGSTVFSSLTRFGFGFTLYDPRGMDERFNRASLAGLEVSSGIGRYPDYNLYTALATLSPQESRSSGSFTAGFHTPLYTDNYDIRASCAPQGVSATYTYSGKRYRNGMRLRVSGGLGRGWYYSAAARGRWGTDAYVKGVFTDAFMASAALEKIFRKGASLSFFVMAAPQERAMKGWTEKEAYELTGDNQYNPYWGMYGGRVRNSRVRRDFTPLAAASFMFSDRRGVHYRVSAGYRSGWRSRSGLSWSGASNPAPDYYSNLPNHRAEPYIAQALEKAWRSGDLNVRQLDWDAMCEANMFAPDGASLYFADQRNERLEDLQAAFGARSPEREGFGYDYGVRFRYGRSNFYRVAGDLLGGSHIHNRDHFTGAESNMLEPGRLVGSGERYDYDYDILRREATAYGTGHYRRGRLRISFGAELSFTDVERVGHYEKETLPGGLSLGPSGRKEFTPFSAFLYASYNFSAGHNITAEIYTGAYAPFHENIFLSPDYSNAAAEGPETENIYGVRLDYRLPVSYFAFIEVSGYLMRSFGGSQLTRYYDDLYGKFCALFMHGISKSDWGVETGIRIDITERLGIAAAISVGSNTYGNEPELSITEDATGTVLMKGDRAHLEGFVHTPSPQTMIAAAINYSTRSQWRFTLECMYADRRYATVNPLRRTDRIASLTASPEGRLACIRQERLPRAWVLNAGVTKGFTVSRVRFFASVTVSNLLGKGDIIYGGYEQMRLDKYTVDGRTAYRPFPSRYSYSYPRTLLASLTLSF